ncbi:ketosynthase [Variovorax defluvii]|uniref:Ketosynthase n=1 Tax=Variovorax defluvii TaxID=913761 RepID=A0ABP8HV00_9BURK
MALLLLAGVAYAGVSHWMMLFHAAEPWAVGVLLGPLWLTALGLAGSRFGAPGLAVAGLAGVLGFALVLRGDAGDPNRLYMLQHVGINALLCGWFGSTLRSDRLSLIGQFAQRIHALSPAMREYTRRVTWVWTAYFASMALASVAVYATLSFAAWSVLANLLSPLLVGVLFVGEYLLRYRLHPEFERTRLVDAVRAFYSVPADPAARQ